MKAAWCYCLLIILCLALYLPGIASIPIVDRDSPHFAQASRQMILDHDYWTIRFEDTPRHLKPPGIYWLHTLSVKLFSHAQSNAVWPYLLISVLGGLLAVLLTFGFTSRVYGQQVGFIAAALLATSPLLVAESHLVVTDSTLLATMVMMQGALWQLYISQREGRSLHWGWALIFWLGMSAGIVIKGITPLVAGLTVVAICIFDRNLSWLKCLRLQWGIPLVLVLTAAWLVPLSLATHSNFLLDMFYQDALPKLRGGQQSHGMPPGYFLAIFTLVFWPGALFIWMAIHDGWQQRHQASIRFLLAWIVPTWLFFELMPTKLPEYVLPVFPAIAILIALAVVPGHQNRLGLWRWLSRIQYCIWVLVGLVIIDVVTMVPYHLNHEVSRASIIVAAILIGTIMGAFVAIYRNQLMRAAGINILGMTLTLMVTLHFIVPHLQNVWVSQQIYNTIAASAPEELSNANPLISIGYAEPSLVFLLGRHKVLPSTVTAVVNQLQQQPIRLILVKQDTVLQVEDLAQKQGIQLKQVAKIHGFNYSKGHWVTLILLKREG